MNKVTRFISAAAALMLVVVSCAKQELPVSTFKMDSATVIVSAGGVSIPYHTRVPLLKMKRLLKL